MAPGDLEEWRIIMTWVQLHQCSQCSHWTIIEEPSEGKEIVFVSHLFCIVLDHFMSMVTPS